MRFKLEDFHRNIPDKELLEDLQKVGAALAAEKEKLTFRSYDKHGKFTAGTFGVRFGSWNKALIAAGLIPNQEKDVSIDSLFENLRNVWLAIGKQPVFRDMSQEPSRYTASIYNARFGTWRKALQEFIRYVESEKYLVEDSNSKDTSPIKGAKATSTSRRRINRSISERMRFRILLRDGFSCQSCGASPLQQREVELHVDHILPWSKGGETEDENLQTKCTRCNLGKGNAFDS